MFTLCYQVVLLFSPSCYLLLSFYIEDNVRVRCGGRQMKTFKENWKFWHMNLILRGDWMFWLCMSYPSYVEVFMRPMPIRDYLAFNYLVAKIFTMLMSLYDWFWVREETPFSKSLWDQTTNRYWILINFSVNT